MLLAIKIQCILTVVLMIRVYISTMVVPPSTRFSIIIMDSTVINTAPTIIISISGCKLHFNLSNLAETIGSFVRPLNPDMLSLYWVDAGPTLK